jgi:hypothetical protein
MKLCSQCDFIYEDDQERCDMDGAELVYEPTLETASQTALETDSKLQRLTRAKLIIPLPGSPSQVPAPLIAAPGRIKLQIAAVLTLAVVAFAAYYVSPRLSQTRNQNPTGSIETPIAPPVNSESLDNQSGASASSNKLETPGSKHETLLATDNLRTVNTKPDTTVPALPGLKPLPRLKPLPTLKPLPRLADQSRSQSPSRKASVVNTKENTNAKKESRFGSFLKKTGRILTKPFKS